MHYNLYYEWKEDKDKDSEILNDKQNLIEIIQSFKIHKDIHIVIDVLDCNYNPISSSLEKEIIKILGYKPIGFIS